MFKIFKILTALFIVLSVISCNNDDDDNGSSGEGVCTSFDGRIINGTECKEKRSPVASIKLEHEYGESLCTGTLITSDIILTAGHCFSSGEVFYSGKVKVGGKNYNATQYIVHPDYDEWSGLFSGLIYNDAALVKLEKSVSDITPVPILNSRNPKVGNEIEIFGYGQRENGDYDKLYGGTMVISGMTKTHIEAYFGGTGSNSCFGDSGGPAFLKIDGQLTVAGITSTGTRDDCLAGDTTKFTLVPNDSIINFILKYAPNAVVK